MTSTPIHTEANPETGGPAEEYKARETAPGLEMVELSLFGPGYGECAVVHLGHGRWMIVDSCVDALERPVALEYLRGMGVDLESQVAHIVITHWDDDHVQGSAATVQACRGAEVWVPEATRTHEMAALILSDVLEPQAGLVQLRGIMKPPKRRTGRIHLTKEEIPISDAEMERANPPTRIWALSPSDEDIRAGFAQVFRLLPSAKNGRLNVGRPRHNDFSVVLHVQVGEQVLLLGGDRERRGPTRGWPSAQRAFVRRGLPPSSLYKVSHHGSESGEYAGVWDVMTSRPLVAVLSPFNRVKGGLPRESDVVRLCSRTDTLAVSSWTRVPPDYQPISSDPIMDADDIAVGEYLISDDAAQPPVGHVRCRANAKGGPWTVEAFSAASIIC